MIEPPRDVAESLELAPRLTAFDRSLIRLLQEDGRRSLAQLSEELGVAARTVRRRIDDLCATGVITITTVGDPKLLGYRVAALVGIRVDASRPAEDIARDVSAASGAFYVIVSTGRYNILAEISCRDQDDMLRMVQNEIASVPGVTSFEIYEYLRLHYQNPSFEAAREKALAAGEAEHRMISFDKMDRAIIARLQEDGRVPYQTIARGLGISETQVRKRMRRMISSGSLRVMALTSPRGVGFETVALIGVRVSQHASIRDVAAKISALPAVIYVAICAGEFHLFAEVVCTDGEDLLTLLDEQLRMLPGVEYAEPWIYLRLFYRSVRPADDARVVPLDLPAEA